MGSAKAMGKFYQTGLQEERYDVCALVSELNMTLELLPSGGKVSRT